MDHCGAYVRRRYGYDEGNISKTGDGLSEKNNFFIFDGFDNEQLLKMRVASLNINTEILQQFITKYKMN